MAQFRLRAKFQGRGSTFRDLAGKFIGATDAVIESFMIDRKADIIDNYNLYKSLVGKRAHPLTEVTDKEPDQLHLDLDTNIEVRKEPDGVFSVGFFDKEKNYMAIVYLQEFGGNILVTEKMRGWYNMMARKNDFPPMNPETRFIVIPEGRFMRNAFVAQEFGSAKRIANLLRFAVKSTFTELRAETAEQRSLSTIGRFESGNYSGETPPSA